jgi:hypothetical protein
MDSMDVIMVKQRTGALALALARRPEAHSSQPHYYQNNSMKHMMDGA